MHFDSGPGGHGPLRLCDPCRPGRTWGEMSGGGAEGVVGCRREAFYFLILLLCAYSDYLFGVAYAKSLFSYHIIMRLL